MGACASVPKVLRTESAAPAPEPAKEETITAGVMAPDVTSVEAGATKEEEVAEKKADEGDDKTEDKAVEVEPPTETAEVETEKPAREAPPVSESVAAVEEKKTEAAEQN